MNKRNTSRKNESAKIKDKQIINNNPYGNFFNTIFKVLITVSILLIIYILILISPLEQFLPIKINFYNQKSSVVGFLAIVVIIINIIGIHKVKK